MTDPSKETIAAALRLAQSDDAWYGRTDGDPPKCWHEQSKEHFFALKAYRAEIAPKLRSRAEVDAELAAWVRESVTTKRHINPTWERVLWLCDEPIAPEPAADENGDPIPTMYKDCGTCRYPSAGVCCGDEWCIRRGCCGHEKDGE